MGKKGSTTQTTNQTNNPPAWAMPLLQKVAEQALGMYNSGQGYNVYRGPTQAEFSPQRLEGLNRAMMMTGSTGPKITNESIFNTKQIQEQRAMIAKQVADEQARKAAAAAAAAEAAKKKKSPYDRYRENKYRPDSGGGGAKDRSESSGYGGSAKGIGGKYGGGGTGSSAYGGKGPTGGNKGGLY